MGKVITTEMFINDYQIKELIECLAYIDDKFYKETKPKPDTSIKYFAKQKSNYKSKRKRK